MLVSVMEFNDPIAWFETDAVCQNNLALCALEFHA